MRYVVDLSTPLDGSRLVRDSVSPSFGSILAYSELRRPTAHLLLILSGKNEPKAKSETHETARKKRAQKHQGKNKKAAENTASQKNK